MQKDSLLELVRNNKGLFTNVFPSVTTILDEFEKEKDKGTCPPCTVRKYENRLIYAIMSADKSKKNLQAFSKFDNVGLKKALSKTYLLPPSFNEGGSTAPSLQQRETCFDCVCKHLSQALILADEVVQGYPEHVSYMARHIDEAIEYSATRGRLYTELKKIKIEIQATDKALLTGDGVESHLKKADDAIKNILTSRTTRPLDIWRVIGHLGEAADECVTLQPALAGRIREERILLMEDPTYRPPIAALLNEARRSR